jgi:hypothetical protein
MLSGYIFSGKRLDLWPNQFRCAHSFAISRDGLEGTRYPRATPPIWVMLNDRKIPKYANQVVLVLDLRYRDPS